MRNKSSTVSLLLVLMLAFLVGGCGSIVGQGSIDPVSTPAPTPLFATPTWVKRTNITREQYGQALAKWQAQRIEEYELQVEHWAYSELMGIWTLHVQVMGDDAKVVEYTREPGLTAPEGGVGSQGMMPTTEDGKNYLKEQLKPLTVEGMLAEVDAILNQDSPLHTSGFTANGNFFMFYEVSLNPQLGYPSHIAAKAVTAPGVSVTDADWTKTVKEFKIIKRMPATSP